MEADYLEAISFSSIKDVELGDVVFAIGDPFGVGPWTWQHRVIGLLPWISMGLGLNRFGGTLFPTGLLPINLVIKWGKPFG